MEVIFYILLGLTVFFIWRKIVGKEKSNRVIREFSDNTNTFIDNSNDLLKNVTNKVKKDIDKSITKSYISGYNWIVLTNEQTPTNEMYTFLSNNQLLITKNGIAEKGTYQLFVDNNSVLISINGLNFHYNIVNLKNDMIFLQKVMTNEFLILMNQTKIKDFQKSELRNDIKRDKEVEYSSELERTKYTLSKNPDHLFMSFYQTWQNAHPEGNLTDYLNQLENKYKDKYNYNIWKKYNPSKTRIDYGEFLIEKDNKS